MMNRFSAFLFIFCGTFCCFSAYSQTWDIQLLKAHQLELQGYSNTIDFTCTYQKNAGFPTKKYTLDADRNFSVSPIIYLKVEGLDCGHAGINYDMKKTLQAEKFPHILIQPKHSFTHLLPSQGNKLTGTVQVQITLAGVTKPEQVKVTIVPKSHQVYRITGKHRLYFTRYGLDPPSAMFGMIRVEDGIDLEFDLELKIIPNP